MPTEEDDRPLTICREDLYELVWSKPMQELAKDFGISDVGLAKRCRRLGIPVPGRGYWARVDAGQKIHRPKLPEREPQWGDESALTVASSDRAQVTHGDSDAPDATTEAESERARKDAEWLAERIEFEKRAESRIVVEAAPTRWHPVVRKYRGELQAAAKEMLKSKAAAERWDKLPEARKRGEWNSDGYRWRSVERRGQRLRDTHKATAVRVSLGTYERALKILEALARAAEARGFTILDREEDGRIALAGHGAEVHLRIVEQLEQKVRRVRRYDGQMENESYKVPTGRLRITLGEGYGERPHFEDRARAALESLLNELFIAVYRQVVRAWRDQREEAARERRWAEEERLRKIAAEQEAERRRRAAAERRRRRGLRREARRWTEARRIRDYVAHVGAAVSANPALAEWMQWALAVADEMDPAETRLGGARSRPTTPMPPDR